METKNTATYNGYTPTIGIEVHAELRTKTKMFCNSVNDPHAGEPNTHICPVCMGHPGTLPVINKQAVKHVLTVGIALGSELATYTEFDRKNYFYPDIPKGYQISQYLYPLVKGGVLDGVAITRVHLEEDTARSLHDQGDGSIIDYNRAGVPLMELVTEPVIHDAKTAGNFARELQLLLRTLGVSDANMEKGEMRVEANISISKTDTFGTKVEVKNINSFKAVESAIEYEIRRQYEVLEGGESVIQETRGWDENKGKTFSQRKKESANDYRYFPDPDLPKLSVGLSDEFSLASLAENLPVLPAKRREIYSNLGISREQIEIIISNLGLTNFFDSVVSEAKNDSKFAQRAANYLTTDVAALLTEESSIDKASLTGFSSLIELLIEGKISSRVAKDLLPEVVFGDRSAAELINERGLEQSDSKDTLTVVVENIIAGNESIVREYREGKESALQYLVGQGMKATKGAANPIMLREVLIETIGKLQ
jgi:aspartyl-tRNA(Asn)/glutamyl-tRNA(Gln) amidotransferase subunit B